MDRYRDSKTREIGLLIADVDGTLVTPQKVLTQRTRQTVERLHEAGIAFAITSSRPPRGLRMLIEPLKITAPLAAFNGGVFVNPDLSILSQEVLSVEVVESAIQIIESYGLEVWVYSGSDWFVGDCRGSHVVQEERTLQFSATAVENFDNLSPRVAKVVGVGDDYEAVARCEADVRRELDERVSASRSQPYYLDVTHPNANKGMVVRKLSEYFGIPLKNIAVIGDGPNDVLMFAISGLSIAMGNASTEVQRAARCVTSSNEEDGFANAVQRYILNETASAILSGAPFAPGRH